MLWDDPLDALIENLDRAVPARNDSPGHFDLASMQADHVALLEYMQALLARPRDPDRLRRVAADPRVQRALENLHPRTG